MKAGLFCCRSYVLLLFPPVSAYSSYCCFGLGESDSINSRNSFKVPDCCCYYCYGFSPLAVKISISLPLFSSFSLFLCLKKEPLRGPLNIDWRFFWAWEFQSILLFLCGAVLDMAELGCCWSCCLLSNFFLVAIVSLPVMRPVVEPSSFVFLLR